MYLSAPSRHPGLSANGDSFFQMLAGRGPLPSQEQGATDEKMPEDEKRSRLMLCRTHQTPLGEIPAFDEGGARGRVGADSGEHREDLRRLPQLVTQFKRRARRVAAGWRGDAPVLGVDAAEDEMGTYLLLDPLARGSLYGEQFQGPL